MGNYIFGQTLGEGTFGKVKLGVHVLSGEKVAIKILEKSRLMEEADRVRVQKEIAIHKMIRHPHIIQLLDVHDTLGQILLIMEYASGKELFEYIVNCTRVQEPLACKFFHQIIAGVDKIHQLKIVHR